MAALGTIASVVLGKKERGVIELAIPFIEKNGSKWIREKKCVSCHQVNSMLWSLSLAKEKGFAVSDNLENWVNWSVGDSLRKNDKGKVVGHLNKEGVSQLLYGVKELSDRNRTNLIELLNHAQQPDGTWDPGGQLPNQKRPSSETSLVSTMWISLSASQKAMTKAKPVIKKRKIGESTEWYALRLLLSGKMDDSPEEIEFHAQALLDKQQQDGGWGWLTHEESDALGTGMALFALNSTVSDDDSRSLELAKNYLINTQQNNGSWVVKGTKKKKRHVTQETSTFWGTAWAVIALSSGIQ